MGEPFAKAPEHVEVILVGKIGVESADDVELRPTGREVANRLFENLLERIGPCAGLAHVAAVKRAELAGVDADVGVIDVAVDVVIRVAPVQPLAHRVSHLPQRENVRRSIQFQCVI